MSEYKSAIKWQVGFLTSRYQLAFCLRGNSNPSHFKILFSKFSNLTAHVSLPAWWDKPRKRPVAYGSAAVAQQNRLQCLFSCESLLQ